MRVCTQGGYITHPKATQEGRGRTKLCTWAGERQTPIAADGRLGEREVQLETRGWHSAEEERRGHQCACMEVSFCFGKETH